MFIHRADKSRISALPLRSCPMTNRIANLRLTHPDLDFWVDVRLRDWDGRWLAVADFAGEPDVGTGTEPRAALRAALTALGEPYATEMAEGADLSA